MIALVERDFFAPLRPQVGAEARVEFTADGYLRLDAALAASRFPSDAVAAVGARRRPVADPVAWAAQRGSAAQTAHPAGDRATLIREVLADRIPEGVREAFWDDANKALRIPLDRHWRAGAVIVMSEESPVRRKTEVPEVTSTDEALDVQTVVVEERGRWAVEIVVVFADGVVRKRIDTHATRGPRRVVGQSDQARRRARYPWTHPRVMKGMS